MKIFGTRFHILRASSRDSAGELPPDEDRSPGGHSDLVTSLQYAIESGQGLYDAIYRGSRLTPAQAAAIPTIYACIRLIAGAFSRMPPYLEDADGYKIENLNDIKDNRDRAMAELLFGDQLISGLFILPDLLVQMATDMAVYGNTFLEKKYDHMMNLVGFEYRPAHHASGSLGRDQNDIPFAFYKLRRMDSQKNDLHTIVRGADLVHARLPRVASIETVSDSYGSGLLGTSPLRAAQRPGEIYEFTDKFIRDYFQHGGWGDVLVFAKDLEKGPKEAARLQNQLNSPSAKRQRFKAMAGEGSAQSLNVDTQSGAVAQMRTPVVDDIARCFGVPGALLNAKTTEVGAGLQELSRMFLKFCLANYRAPIENAFTFAVFSGRLKFRLDASRFEAADFKSMASLISAIAQNKGKGGEPIMARDEIRALVDIPHLKRAPETAGAAGNDDDEDDDEE